MRPILGQKGWRILLSDPDGKVAQLFEVWDLNRKRARRVAFLIDRTALFALWTNKSMGARMEAMC
ncbi:MAG: hypothetical protein IMHGJWDQ_001733 [Candidatus Fervidibacter sp.]